MSTVSDLTLEVLKGIRSDLQNLSTEVRTGFASVNQRIDGLGERANATNERLDSVIKIVGSHHDRLTERVCRIEDHLGLPHEP